MARAGPRKVQRYSLKFKLKAVKLSQPRGVQIQAVADALEIHPFMLSKWRKEAREGVLRGRVARVYRRNAGTHRWFGQHPNHVRGTRATGPTRLSITG
jgi:transposase